MPEPFHIAIVMTNATQRGGAERLLQYLLRNPSPSLRLSLAFLEDGPMVREAREHGHDTVVLPAPRIRNLFGTIAVILRLRTWIRERQPDLVFGWMKKAHIYSGIAASGIVPAAWFQHENPEDGRIDALIHRIRSSGIACCSDLVRDQQLSRTPSIPCATVHPCQDVASEPVADIPWPVPPGIPGIVMVCRLQTWKGPHLAVQALRRLSARTGLDAHLVIVGGQHELEPEYPAFLAAQIAKEGLKDSIHLVGFQTSPASWMRKASIVVHASHGEPFGMVVAEAIALGVPVVAARPGGPEEIVRPDIDGVLWNHPDVEDFSRAMERALQMPRRAEEPERFGVGAYLARFEDTARGFAATAATCFLGSKKTRI